MHYSREQKYYRQKIRKWFCMFFVMILAATIPISPFSAMHVFGEDVYFGTFYVSASGSDLNDGLSESTPFATLRKTADVINDSDEGKSYLVNVMSNLTSTETARYHDRSVTIMSYNGGLFTVTRGAGFGTVPDNQRGWYNPPMLEIETWVDPDPPEVTLTLQNIIFDDAYMHEGTKFKHAPNDGASTTGTDYVQDSIVATYSPYATIILNNGAELRNFGGMTAILADNGTVIMNSGSLITDIGSSGATRQVSTNLSDWTANGEAAVRVSGKGFFMYAGAAITNIANAHSVKLNGGSYKCLIDGEIANMKGNKGMDTGDEGRGGKNAVCFNRGTTLDPYTGVPGSAIIGPNANIHDNATKCGAVMVNRSTGISVKIYGKINNNEGGTGSTSNLAGTNGGGLYIVAGGTIYLEDGCEVKNNRTNGFTSYGGAASVQQSGSVLIMNGGTVTGNSSPALNTPSSVGGIAVNKGDARFEMNGGIIDNGVNGIWLFNNSIDTDCNGRLTLNAGVISGVTVRNTVVYGNNTQRNLFIKQTDALTIKSGYASVAGRQVTPISADFYIGNPNTANYANINSALPKGWTMPTTASNVIGFWMKKNGTAVFSVPAPASGTAPTNYNRPLGVYFAAVQGTLANGTVDSASPMKLYPTTVQSGKIIVSVPLNALANGATVVLVQPTDKYGIIDFKGPSTLTYDPDAAGYTIPYTAAYDMPEGLQVLLVTDGHENANTDFTLTIRPAPGTIPDPGSLTIDSEIFEISGVPVWNGTAGELVVILVLKNSWDTTKNLETKFEFSCEMDASNFIENGILSLTGELVIEGDNGSLYYIYGNQANTKMIIDTIDIKYIYSGSEEYTDQNSGNVAATLLTSGKYGSTIASAPDPNPTREGYTFKGWRTGPSGTGTEWIFGAAGTGTLLTAANGVDKTAKKLTLYAKWEIVGTPPPPTPPPQPPQPPKPPTPPPTINIVTEQDTKDIIDEEPIEIEKQQIQEEQQPTQPPAVTPPVEKNAWALVNLILTVVGLLLVVATLIRAQRQKSSHDEYLPPEYNEEKEEERRKQSGAWRIVALILCAAGIIIFLFTEDMRNPMTLIDRWTLVNAVIFVAEAICIGIASKRKKEESEDDIEV